MVGPLIAGLALMSFMSSGSSAAVAAPLVSIFGEGSWGPYQEIVPWQNDLAGDPNAPKIDLGFSPTGSFLGRQDFLDGNADFVISGVPFTSDELAKLKNGADDLIDVPIFVTALAFVVRAPYPDRFVGFTQVCDPNDPPPGTDPSSCFTRQVYPGPLKIPSLNLSGMMMRLSTFGDFINVWNNQDVLDANGVQAWTIAPLASPAPIVRSEPDETTLYLQTFVKQTAPSLWSLLTADNPKWDPPTEHFVSIRTASRQGVDQQSLQLGLKTDPVTGTFSTTSAGSIADVTPGASAVVQQAFPDAELFTANVKNANGDWVAPTPDTINAAVNAGGDTPLYALNNKVANAYPMVWVDHLYAHAHGLSPDATEAMATTIRYLATAGQDQDKTYGDGRLPSALVTKALAGADQLVKSNCVGNDRTLSQSTDPGRFAPNLPALKSIGSMQHCAVKTSSTPATTSSPATVPSFSSSNFSTTPAFNSSPFNLTPLPAAPTAVSDSETTSASSSTGTVTKRKNGVLSASRLPLPAPGSSQAPDRLAALFLGAGLFLILRPVLRKLLTRFAR
jgi:hypothetical protein